MPEGTFSEVSFTSAAFSPKMARSRRSSGASSVSLLGVILPTRMSPGLTSAPMRMTPSGPRFFKRLFAQVGNVAGDFLRAELGVAGADFEFVNVNGGEDVVLDDAFADEDGVLEVVAVPGHERAEDVAAQGQFAALGAGAVGDDLALLDGVALGDEDFLVDAGGGVGTHEFADGINPDAVGRIVLELLLAVGHLAVRR